MGAVWPYSALAAPLGSLLGGRPPPVALAAGLTLSGAVAPALRALEARPRKEGAEMGAFERAAAAQGLPGGLVKAPWLAQPFAGWVGGTLRGAAAAEAMLAQVAGARPRDKGPSTAVAAAGPGLGPRPGGGPGKAPPVGGGLDPGELLFESASLLPWPRSRSLDELLARLPCVGAADEIVHELSRAKV